MHEIVLERILKVLKESRNLEYAVDEIQSKIEYGAIEDIEHDIDVIKGIAIKMDLLERELYYIYLKESNK